MHFDFWNWELVKEIGANKYYQHSRTSKRRVACDGYGFSPVDQRWLLGGEFMDRRPPPTPAPPPKIRKVKVVLTNGNYCIYKDSTFTVEDGILFIDIKDYRLAFAPGSWKYVSMNRKVDA